MPIGVERHRQSQKDLNNQTFGVRLADPPSTKLRAGELPIFHHVSAPSEELFMQGIASRQVGSLDCNLIGDDPGAASGG